MKHLDRWLDRITRHAKEILEPSSTPVEQTGPPPNQQYHRPPPPLPPGLYRNFIIVHPFLKAVIDSIGK